MSATVTYHELPPVTSWANGAGLPPTPEQRCLFGPAGSEVLQWNGYAEPTTAEFHAATGPSMPTLSWNPPPSPSSFGHPLSQPPSYHAVSGKRPLLNGVKKRPVSLKYGMSGSHNSGPEELCLVCGDKASGYHYNALTCEGCKGFFRRSITKKARYICKYGNNCDIDMYMRRKCQFCRLRKCFTIGMRQELVIPEDKCKKYRESKLKMKANAEESNSAKFTSCSSSPQQVGKVTSTDSLSPLPGQGLSPEQNELIQRLIQYQEHYDLPSDEDLAKLSRFQTTGVQEFQHLAELTILNVQLIMAFTKSLPGFLKLVKEDQMTLLKAGTFEALMLRMCRRYECKSDSIILGNQSTSWAYNREAYKQAGIGSATDAIFQFARSMAKMRVDDSEYALLTAITLFSERPGLLEPKKVEEIQEVYTSALQVYIDQHRAKNRTIFARLLVKLTDLRSLSSEHADTLFALKVNSRLNVDATSEDSQPELLVQPSNGAAFCPSEHFWPEHQDGTEYGAPKLASFNNCFLGLHEPPEQTLMVKSEPHFMGNSHASYHGSAMGQGSAFERQDMLHQAVLNTFSEDKLGATVRSGIDVTSGL